MDKITPIKEKILLLVENMGISKLEFSNTTGISYANLKGKGLLSEIGGAQIGKILSCYPKVNPEWLLTGNGPMYKDSAGDNGVNCNVINEPVVQYDKLNSLPLIPLSAIAGKTNGDVSVMDYDILDRYIIPEFQGKADFLIRVAGTSMSPKFYHGDLIACKKINEITFIQWGKAYVLDTIQGPIVKRLYEDPANPENILCISDNKDLYPPFTLPKSEIRSLSLVIGSIRVE